MTAEQKMKLLKNEHESVRSMSLAQYVDDVHYKMIRLNVELLVQLFAEEPSPVLRERIVRRMNADYGGPAQYDEIVDAWRRMLAIEKAGQNVRHVVTELVDSINQN